MVWFGIIENVSLIFQIMQDYSLALAERMLHMSVQLNAKMPLIC